MPPWGKCNFLQVHPDIEDLTCQRCKRKISHVQVNQQYPCKRLDPETWGEQMRRARRRAGNPTLDHMADVLSRWASVDKATLSRLERLATPPHDEARRQRAALMLVLYGFGLEDFQLTADDVPRGIDVAAFLADAETLTRAIGGHLASLAAA